MNFSEKQIKFMNDLGLDFNFDNLSDDEQIKIEDIISEKLQKSGFDQSNDITVDGRMCESILDQLA